METQHAIADTPVMTELTEEICNDLFEVAVNMAYRTFDEATTDAHVLSVYERVMWNYTRGLGLHDVMTVH